MGSANEFQNRWELQGKEAEQTFGLNRVNFGARVYNPTIGRWDRVDNFSELMPNLSGYRYSFNNPVNVTDPDGNFEDFEYSDGYSMNSTANGTISMTSFSGTYSTGKQDGCPPNCGGYGGGDPSTPYNGNTTGTAHLDLEFKQGKSRLRPEVDDAAVLGVDIAAIIEAPYALWKGALKLFSSLKGVITVSDLTKGAKFSQSAADNLVVTLKSKYGGNVTVMKDGQPIFRVHQPETHGNLNATVTEFSVHTNPHTGISFSRPNPKVSSFDRNKFEILNQAHQGQGGYSLKTKGGR